MEGQRGRRQPERRVLRREAKPDDCINVIRANYVDEFRVESLGCIEGESEQICDDGSWSRCLDCFGGDLEDCFIEWRELVRFGVTAGAG